MMKVKTGTPPPSTPLRRDSLELPDVPARPPDSPPSPTSPLRGSTDSFELDLPSPPGRGPTESASGDLDDLMARLEALRGGSVSPPPAEIRLDSRQINDIDRHKLGIRSGSSPDDARNAAYSLAATLKPTHLLRMDAADQEIWANNLRGSIQKMLDLPGAEDRHLILASGVGADPKAESYNARDGLRTFPKGQVNGQALVSTPLAEVDARGNKRLKGEDELMSWVMSELGRDRQ
jgi:hypothetical protein